MADAWSGARQQMVREQIEKRGIRDGAVLAAMREVPRHRFVPADMEHHAYEDRPLPIGYGQTISQPYIVAAMSEMLRPDPKARVLEIGTGSGYQAAVLGRLFREVYSIEIEPALARRAAALLRELKATNIETRLGDGYAGWPEKAPFDRILLTAAPPEVPQALIDQLGRGGRLVAPVGSDPNSQYLLIIERDAEGKLKRTSGEAVRFVPMVRPQ